MSKWKRGIQIVAIYGLFSAVIGAFITSCVSAKRPLVYQNSGVNQPGQEAGEPGVAAPPELWILAREKGNGTGGQHAVPASLTAETGGKQVAFPLRHTEVSAEIQGFVANVQVAQQFQNPFSHPIEAKYVFPLPHDGAVTDFMMTVGQRKIRGIIRERKEAEEIYAAAKALRHAVSLLTEERPNVFTQTIGNLEPGKEVTVRITYFAPLPCSDGWFEFVFPTVAGPRYNPAGLRNGIGAVVRGNTGGSGQPTEVEYLKPGERQGQDIKIRVDLNAGAPIQALECNTHRIAQQELSPEHRIISLGAAAEISNRDFILRYRLAGEEVRSSLVTQRDERGGYFLLSLYPPVELKSLPRRPVELIFLIDCSASMSGTPLAQAKQAVDHTLDLLGPEDSFALLSFSMRTSAFGEKLLPATTENVARARQYLTSLEVETGTEMLSALRSALTLPGEPNRVRFVSLLSDGQIGNEAQCLAEVHRKLGAARIFAFGVGSSVNHYLLSELAAMGHGSVAFLGAAEAPGQTMEDFFERISHPVLTNIQIDWGNLNPLEVYPREMPDVFNGRPLLVSGRFTADNAQPIKVSGTAGGNRVSFTVPVSFSANKSPILPLLWARTKIAALEEESTYNAGDSLVRQIKEVALDYNLSSPYTAFVMVDAGRKTAGAPSATVPVAVPSPEGVDSAITTKDQ
jgi:Ca-activated chloride channel homolog